MHKNDFENTKHYHFQMGILKSKNPFWKFNLQIYQNISSLFDVIFQAWLGWASAATNCDPDGLTSQNNQLNY